MSDTSQRLAFVIGINGVGRILDHQQVVFICRRHDTVHVAGHTSIMHHNYDLRFVVDERFDSLSSDIGVIRPAVSKAYHCAFPQKGDGGRNKRVRGHDHLIARFQFTQHGTHLQSIGTRGAEQTFPETIAFLEETMTQLGEVAIARHRGRLAHFLDITDLSA